MKLAGIGMHTGCKGVSMAIATIAEFLEPPVQVVLMYV